MPNKTLQDFAEKVMKKKKKPIDFKKLWDEVCREVNFTEVEKKKKMAKFYNSITLDPRFVQLEKNTWDLKSRQSYNKLKVNVETIDFEEEEEAISEDMVDDSLDTYDSVSTDIY